jgi:hypothetical protein
VKYPENSRTTTTTTTTTTTIIICRDLGRITQYINDTRTRKLTKRVEKIIREKRYTENMKMRM